MNKLRTKRPFPENVFSHLVTRRKRRILLDSKYYAVLMPCQSYSDVFINHIHMVYPSGSFAVQNAPAICHGDLCIDQYSLLPNH